ncbi:MAG TPA: DUF3866 family protein [Candidatus Anoxymicrobiaceae bacterium]
MSSYRVARVTGVEPWVPGASLARLEFEDGVTGNAISFEQLSGTVSEGDRVIANTTAVELGLGSGGYHFILWNMERSRLDTCSSGHIMKLRYTPLQFNVEAIEESLADLEPGDLPTVLEGMPVVAGSLHSQLLPVAIAYKHARPGRRLVYVMTDGGALPAAFSKSVWYARQRGYIDAVITCGNAFGGDLEAVTAHGALVAARKVSGADAVVALMGPGIAGTGSPVGFSGVEQAVVLNAASSMGGAPVAVARITFKDKRSRHFGISHHTIAALQLSGSARVTVAIPALDGDKGETISRQIDESGMAGSHEIRIIDAEGVLELLEACDFEITVMGRGVRQEPEYFMAAGAAGLIAAEIGGD